MTHHFNVEVAEQFGVNAAILLQNISFWVAKSAANGDNFHDGDFWTYNSNKAFQKLFPYLTSEQIRYALKKLIDGGVIKTGCFNKAGYDRTKWFALTDKGKAISGFSEMDLGTFSNESGDIPEPIPDKKPDKNSDNKSFVLGNESSKPQKTKHFVPPALEEVRAYCIERNNGIDPQRFVDFYASKGWRVGNTPMRDWQAAIRVWEGKRKQEGQHDFNTTGNSGKVFHLPATVTVSEE